MINIGSKMLKLQDFIDIPTKDTTLQIIRDNFYNLRKSKKLSREKLSLISGVDVGVIRRFEESKKITLENLIHLAFALDANENLIDIFKIKKEIKIYE